MMGWLRVHLPTQGSVNTRVGVRGKEGNGPVSAQVYSPGPGGTVPGPSLSPHGVGQLLLRSASHPGSDIDRVHALGQGVLQVLQRVQALHFAAAAVDELPEGVLLQQGFHVLEEEALAEQGQLRGVVDLWRERGGATVLAQPPCTYPPTSPLMSPTQGQSLA